MSPGGFPQPFHVAHRRQAEEPFVLPIEVRGIIITHAVGGTCRVEVLAEHKPAGLLEPQPLLELQGAQRGDGFEVVVEARDAHSELVRDSVDSKRLVKVAMEALDGPGDARGVAA